MSIVIHVGYPKTGTTTLQRHFFPSLPGCIALGPLPYGSAFRVLASNLEQADDESFLEATWRAFLRDSQGAADTLILSREGLSRPEQRTRTADRLHRVAPDARIVVCIRNQRSMLRSFYSQYLKDGGTQSLPDWMRDVFDVEWLHYDRLVAAYQERFGSDRVFVTAYERFASDPQAYFDDLGTFVRPGSGSTIDASCVPIENRALSSISRGVVRGSNWLFRRSRHHRRPPLPSEALSGAVRTAVARVDQSLLGRWSREITIREQEALDRCVPTFRASNERLIELTGLPLAELGYERDGPAPATRGSDDALAPRLRDGG
jgi:hypothetical protein